MKIKDQDVAQLREGQPPISIALLQGMTIRRDLWLDFVKNHYLEQFINKDGSKVKILVGGEGTGKTHLLKCVQSDANLFGYQTVYITLKQQGFKLNDLPSLYQAIVKQVDKERLFRGLCLRVATALGYDSKQYDGASVLLQRMIEEGLQRSVAEKEFRIAVGKAFNKADFGPSFTVFAYNIVKDRMITGSGEVSDAAWRWFSGDKLDRRERIALGFYEQLQKSNARYWLNSLIRMLRLAGIRGLIVLIDDCEVLTELDEKGYKHVYTPNQVKDACEMIRQLIDDFELLGNSMFIFSGNKSMVEDEKRGFLSYEALWMRIRSGLVSVEQFNRLSDMVDTDFLLKAMGEESATQVSVKLQECFNEAGFGRKFTSETLNDYEGSALRRAVIETALYANKKVNGQSV